MNIYDNLNQMIDYIENNLDKEIELDKLAKIVGINSYTLQRFFSLMCGISITEYIRKRRLTVAGRELVQENAKIIDIALKYGYDSATAFSRAFKNFHNILPRDVKNNESVLNYYPKLNFEAPKFEEELKYEVIELDELKLYGFGVKTNKKDIKKDAPNLFKKALNDYKDLPMPNYGMVVYEDRDFSDNYEYWVLWTKKYYDFEEKIIPKSKWLKFKINSDNSVDIQNMSQLFYNSFMETCRYNLRNLPELEYYHDNVTDFLVPIETD